MVVQPLADKIVVKIIKTEENKTKGGILLLNDNTEKVDYAEVIAVSSSKKPNGESIVNEIFVGDKIIIEKHLGIEVSINDMECKIIRQSNILAKIN